MLFLVFFSVCLLRNSANWRCLTLWDFDNELVMSYVVYAGMDGLGSGLTLHHKALGK